VKALFFSPFANIWEHSFPEALIAESFAEKDLEVVMVRCGRMLQGLCVAMSAAGVDYDSPLAIREQICAACEKRRDLITGEMSLPSLIMDAWARREDRDETERLIASLTPSTWHELEVDGIPLGRYAVYEMWLSNKLVSMDFDPDMWTLYQTQVRNTLLTYFAARRILAEQKPDAVVVYNDHYSVNHAFCAAAEKAGIPSYTVHGGHHMIRRSETIMMFSSNHTMENIFESAAWKAYQQQPIGHEEVELVGGHFDGLLQANSAFAYSSRFEGTGPAELRSKLGISPDRRVLLAAMSSEDELIGVRLIDAIPSTINQVSLFEDQFEWVDYLFHYAQENPDIHLVLRLHPRMFPNKREQVMSPVVSRIMALREGAPDNVTFNMPSDGVGLYDLMQVVDVLLNFRSSVGAELAALGIPAVVPANADFYTYPSDINRVGHTLPEFRRLIGEALAEGWSLENSRRAFRWYAFLFGRVAVDFSDAVRSRPVAIRPRKPGLRLRLYNRAVYVFLQFGPLIRERIALRNRRLAPRSREILLDVILNHRDSASDSPLWPEKSASEEEETRAIGDYLLGLSATLWKDIDEPDSLAGHVRDRLAPVATGS
jgi:hypothetical protein